MKLEAIFAITPKGGLGKDGCIPWSLPMDMAHFARTTRACAAGKMNAVIMGRKTWDSLPRKPLKGRANIVVSRTISEQEGLDSGAIIVRSWEEALEHVQDEGGGSGMGVIDRIFVIGGADLLHKALVDDRCVQAHVTQLHQEFECDVYLDTDILHLSYKLDMTDNELRNENGVEFSFQKFRRFTR